MKSVNQKVSLSYRLYLLLAKDLSFFKGEREYYLFTEWLSEWKKVKEVMIEYYLQITESLQ